MDILYLSDSVDSHSSGRKLVEDLIDNLNLGVVIASSESAELRQPSFLGPKNSTLKSVLTTVKYWIRST